MQRSSDSPAADTIDPLGMTVGSDTETSPVPLRRGSFVGRYLILEHVGSGGMGVVYAAHDPDLDRKVALKLVRTGSAPEGRARLLREAQIMARLAHPNVVSIHDVGLAGHELFIAMEFVDGVTLRQWLLDRPRAWREILEVFVAAGRGLIAAHEISLIHRDLKPDNVMVGMDGRVRLMDFGLARSHEPPISADATAVGLARQFPADVTRTGALVGTPAYMAPEQWEGAMTTPKSDQFAYCVALWEALYGSHPFLSESVAALILAVTEGTPRPPTELREVPAWIRAALTRGLRRRPEERWPTMSALLQEFTRDHGATRRRVGIATFATATFVVAWVLNRAESVVPRCVNIDTQFDGIWDGERRAAVKAAMHASGTSYAAATWERSAASLDAYAGAWTDAARALCEADAGALPDSAGRERQQLCLERRRGEFRALTEVLGDGSRESVEHALQAIASLQPPSSCADPAVLAVDHVSPPAVGDLLAVTALRERITKIQAAEWAGRYTAVLNDSAAIVDEARTIGYVPLIAEALVRRASLLARTGDYKGAEVALTEAQAAAESADYALLRAEAVVLRIELVGALMARDEEVAAWTPTAIALVERVQPDSALAGRLWANIGLVDFTAGRYAGAETRQRKALELVNRVLPPDHPERVNALFQLGRTLSRRQSKHDEAVVTLESSRQLAEQILGPEHPVLVPIYLNLANVYGSTDTEKLVYYYERSLSLAEKVLGPNHPQVASALANLANVRTYEGRIDEALANYRRAIDIYVATLGEDHPTTALNLCNYADGLRLSGDLEASRATYRRAVASYERAYRGPHPAAAVAIGGVGDTYAAEGCWEEALDYYRHAAEVAFAGPTEPTFVAIEVLRQVVIAELALGRGDDAIAAAERLVTQAEAHSASEIGPAHYLLAQALALVGDRPRAIAEGYAAIKAMHPKYHASTLSDVQVWITEVETSPNGQILRLPSVPEPRPTPLLPTRSTCPP